MLGKLLKYEIKATARIFIPLLAVLLISAGVNKLISVLSGQTMQAPEIISLILYIMILVGVFMMTLVVMVQRFYKNLLSDEGYLMFTLPAAVWKQIVSKMSVAILWTVASGIAALISIFIIADYKIFTEHIVKGIPDLVNQSFQYFGVSLVFILIEVLLLCILSLASSVLMIYASIAIGHLFNRHKIMASLGAFIVVSTVTQILLVVVGVIGSKINLEGIFVGQSSNMQSFVHIVMWFCIIFLGLLSAGYFALTNHILSKRLNLE